MDRAKALAAVAGCLGTLLISCGSSLAASPAAQGAVAGANAAFPVDPSRTEATEVGRARRMRAAGAPTVTLTPVRFLSEGRDHRTPGTAACGVTLRGPDGKEQSLVTVGQAWTEKLSCDGLVEAGPVRTARGQPPRIALIYRTSSPPGRSRTPVVLAWVAETARWAPEETASIMLGGRRDAGAVACISRILSAR